MKKVAHLLVACGLLGGCVESNTALDPGAPERAVSVNSSVARAGRYLVIAEAGADIDLMARTIEAAGASVVDRISNLALLVVEGAEPAGGENIRAVIPDEPVAVWTELEPAEPATVTVSPTVPGAGSLFALQWGFQAIDASGAWSLGARGAGARVALLDTGIDPDHPDLAPNLNLGLSRSFSPGFPVFVPPVTAPAQLQHHGTQVAGIVGGADDGIGTTGVAPAAELVAIRVIGAANIRFSDWIAGIKYAADIGADVVNMSFGLNFPRQEWRGPAGELIADAREIQELVNALNRATRYARDRGVTLIAAAGNASIDRDHDADRMVIPADLNFVISVSATSPIGLAFDPSANPDIPASYVNFGQSRIDVSAPGGDFRVPGLNQCSVASVSFFCLIFDAVMTTENGGGYRWLTGTSASAPHVAGIAAMLVGLNGGAMDPQQVRALIQRGADDLGKPGRDDYHGHGRANARRAVERMLATLEEP